MITIIDYGAGNLFSVQNALNFLGVENNISSKVEDIISADKLILPNPEIAGSPRNSFRTSLNLDIWR